MLYNDAMIQKRHDKPANKGKKLPPEILTNEEMRRLLDACGRGAAGKRNRAFLATLAGAGLRLAEALALEPKDLDEERWTVRVLHGKGDQARTTVLQPAAALAVSEWLRERDRLGLGPYHPLFCTISKGVMGRPLLEGYVRTLLPRLAKRAGIRKRVHPHGLRHYYAATLRREGVDIAAISQLLGHSSIATTARYLAHIEPTAVIEAARSVKGWSEYE